jgi:hypothetical protein
MENDTGMLWVGRLRCLQAGFGAASSMRTASVIVACFMRQILLMSWITLAVLAGLAARNRETIGVT